MGPYLYLSAWQKNNGIDVFFCLLTLKGELVYVNYARAEDFKQLEDLGVNASGKVVIARYGKIFRGDKVRLGGG